MWLDLKSNWKIGQKRPEGKYLNPTYLALITRGIIIRNDTTLFALQLIRAADRSNPLCYSLVTTWGKQHPFQAEVVFDILMYILG